MVWYMLLGLYIVLDKVEGFTPLPQIGISRVSQEIITYNLCISWHLDLKLLYYKEKNHSALNTFLRSSNLKRWYKTSTDVNVEWERPKLKFSSYSITSCEFGFSMTSALKRSYYRGFQLNTLVTKCFWVTRFSSN